MHLDGRILSFKGREKVYFENDSFQNTFEGSSYFLVKFDENLGIPRLCKIVGGIFEFSQINVDADDIFFVCDYGVKGYVDSIVFRLYEKVFMNSM